MEENEGQFKIGVLFDYTNVGGDRLVNENQELVFGKTGQLYKLAEMLNEAH